MSWSFSLGALFGSELRVHATFFLLLAWIAVTAFLAAGVSAAISNIVFILSLFGCVVLHEFGHAIAAKRYGISTPDITLLPIGGMARLEKMPEKPSEEIVVALAGPAVNLVIWAMLTLAIGVSTDMAILQDVGEQGQGFWTRLATVNLFLAVFNLIPAFPMDGGRVLRALLSFSMKRAKATAYAAHAGQAIAFLFGFWGLTGGNPFLLLIAVFIFLAASAESADVTARDEMQGALARDAMITSFKTLAADDSIDVAAQSLLRTTQGEFPVVDNYGHLMGVLTRAEIVRLKNAHRADALVSAAMHTEIPRVRLNTPLETVMAHLRDSNTVAVAIEDGRDVFLGYVTRENFGEWLLLNQSD